MNLELKLNKENIFLFNFLEVKTMSTSLLDTMPPTTQIAPSSNNTNTTSSKLRVSQIFKCMI